MNISPQTNLSSPVHAEQRTITTGQNPNTSSSKDLASVSATPAVKVSISVSENAQAASNASLPALYSRISLAKSNPEQLYVDDDQRAAPFEGEGELERVDDEAPNERVPSRSQDDSRVDEESNDELADVRTDNAVDIEESAEINNAQETERVARDNVSSDDRGQEGRENRAKEQKDAIEQEQIAELKARDIEVRAHEQAHRAAGGQYARGATFTYQSGPDGVRYAVGGEVQIDVAPIPNDPEATIAKMNTVKAAANAPAEPSAQDRAVAAEAQRMIVQAQAEIAQEKRNEIEQAKALAQENREERQEAEEKAKARKSEREPQTLSVQEFQRIAQLDPNASSGIDDLI